MTRQAFWVLFILALTLSGCISAVKPQEKKDVTQLTPHIYEHPFDRVWESAIAAVGETKLELVLDNKEKGVIEARRKINLTSWGESVTIYVKEVEKDSKSSVMIDSRREVSAGFTSTDWDVELFEILDKKLK